jgi:hypothetical protein
VRAARARGGVLGPGRARVDPLAQRRDLGRAQRLARRRHALVLVGADDAGVQRARCALAGNDHGLGPELRSGERVGAAIEAQSRLLLVRAVALVAARRQERLDVASEIDCARRGGRRVLRARGERAGGAQERDPGEGSSARIHRRRRRGRQPLDDTAARAPQQSSRPGRAADLYCRAVRRPARAYVKARAGPDAAPPRSIPCSPAPALP